MKTRIATYLVIISTILLLIPMSLFAQKTETSIDREFDWTDANKTETLYVDVKKKSSSLLMSFAGAIEKGTLEVNVFNPDGDKIPGFLLVSDGSDDAKVSVEVSSGKNDEGTQVTTSTSSSGSSTSITTTSTSGVGSSSSVTIGKSSLGSAYAISSSSSDSKGAKGVMNKILPDPAAGKWKIVISAKNVTGKLNVAFDQE